MGIINIKHLVHKFKDNDENAEIITAIDGVDLDVEEGQFIAILGHNGSGKSSLAKHINALLAPTEGTVLISGMNTKDEKKIWDIRQQAGMVFQNPDNQIVSAVVEEAFGDSVFSGFDSDCHGMYDRNGLRCHLYTNEKYMGNGISSCPQ